MALIRSTILALTASMALADHSFPSNLPILYRVDQPNSNVVVFRGANVALAKAAGLIGSGYGHGNGNSYGHGNNGYKEPVVTYAPAPTTTPYTTTTTTTTTAAPYNPPQVTYHELAKVSYATPPYNAYANSAPKYSNAYDYAPVEANYDWEYAVKDNHYNDFGHKESRNGYSATGKYFVALPDGRFQTVTYVANENGYVPTVDYVGAAAYPQEAKHAAYGN